MWTLLDLILPQYCAGCDSAGQRWCPRCAATLCAEPMRIRPRTDPGVPCWALTSYAGPPRRAVLAAKESGRRDLAVPLGQVLARGIDRMRASGRGLILVPAPSRPVAARRRGGDPVARAVRVASSCLTDCRTSPVLTARRAVRDSVGLGASARRANLAGGIVVRAGARSALRHSGDADIVLVDDVLTTGATAAESVRVLDSAGVRVRAVLVLCAA